MRLVSNYRLHSTMEPDVGTAGLHIFEHPSNVVYNTDYHTTTNKEWTQEYPAITKMTTYTKVDNYGITYADFDKAFLPLADDEYLRLGEPASAPNTRKWRFETEGDVEHWFASEISNVVLAAWARFPSILQSSHVKPPSEHKAISENIDFMYSVKIGGKRFQLAVGEAKRNTIGQDLIHWQRAADFSKFPSGQVRLSQELRGYCHKYQCPQVFCFDGNVLLLLQFRATTLEEIKDKDCEVDCWVLPREGSNCTLRYALYRLLLQGWKRCQVLAAMGDAADGLVVGGLRPDYREFFNGRPIWKVEGQNYANHPGGYERLVDGTSGALKWRHEEDPEEVEETGPFWGEGFNHTISNSEHV